MMQHGARSLLPGVGNVPGMGPAGCPGSQTGVSASSGMGHGQRRGLLPPRQSGGRGREELPWPHAFTMAPAPWDCWPNTASLRGWFPVEDGSCRRPPGWVLGRASQFSLVTVTKHNCPWPPVCWDNRGTQTSPELHQGTQAALLLLAHSHILEEPWAHPAFCMCGRSTATMAGEVQPCPAPETPPSSIPTCLSCMLNRCLQEEMPLKAGILEEMGDLCPSNNIALHFCPFLV